MILTSHVVKPIMLRTPAVHEKSGESEKLSRYGGLTGLMLNQMLAENAINSYAMDPKM